MTGSAVSPSPAVSPGPAEGPAGQVHGIGAVLNLLRPEFPDLTISKLRFLESEGLVEPLRTSSGYRRYAPAHVARLRQVLTAQRDRFLPLRVIREQLQATERVVGSPVAPAAPLGTAGTGPLTRDELRERSGLTETGLTELEAAGLITPGPGGRYGAEALTVARVAVRLGAYGLHARHLRPYRATADREVGLLAQLMPGLSKLGGRAEPDGRARALQTVHELAGLCAQLHAALVRQGLRSTLGG